MRILKNVNRLPGRKVLTGNREQAPEQGNLMTKEMFQDKMATVYIILASIRGDWVARRPVKQLTQTS